LITLISAKKKSEQKYHKEPTNPTTIATVCLAHTNVKKAIKKAQGKWIRKMIWQSSKLLLAGLSHHHVNTKDKHIKLADKNGNLTIGSNDSKGIVLGGSGGGDNSHPQNNIPPCLLHRAVDWLLY
jgi:hypothetical protein